MKTKQETFNTAYLGLKSQGFEKSYSGEIDECAYRGPEGRKCAAGWCISDEDYSEDIEGCSVRSNDIQELPSVKIHDKDLLADLQHAHDSSSGPLIMQYRLAKVANTHNLTIPAGE